MLKDVAAKKILLRDLLVEKQFGAHNEEKDEN